MYAAEGGDGAAHARLTELVLFPVVHGGSVEVPLGSLPLRCLAGELMRDWDSWRDGSSNGGVRHKIGLLLYLH